MISFRHVATAVTIVVLGTTAASAQKSNLPSGRPFQILQQQIIDVNAALAQQIADLQTKLATLDGRVEAIEQHNITQDQLIGSLQAAIVLLEQKMITAEGRLQNLEAWRAGQELLIQNLQNSIASLQSQVNGLQNQVNSGFAVVGDLLETLFDLHNQQQALVVALQNSINSLQGQLTQTNANIQALADLAIEQQTQLSQLQTQADGLQTGILNLQTELTQTGLNLLATRLQLTDGCAPGSSIRQVLPGGPVICEGDSGQTFVAFSVTQASEPIGPFAAMSATATCPPPPATLPGQAPFPPFLASGGGFSIPIAAQVIASGASSPNSWTITVRNTGATPIQFTAVAHCVRQFPQ